MWNLSLIHIYLPENRDEWDSIFLQAMGDPDPKQIDGLGGTVSSNNKIVIVWKSQVDYKPNCGNMTAAVGPYAVEEGIDVYKRQVQQKLIDVLDQAEYVTVSGRGANETNLKISLHLLTEPQKQTNFENCVADVNIPVGEVFTSQMCIRDRFLTVYNSGTGRSKRIYVNT